MAMAVLPSSSKINFDSFKHIANAERGGIVRELAFISLMIAKLWQCLLWEVYKGWIFSQSGFVIKIKLAFFCELIQLIPLILPRNQTADLHAK